LFHMPLFFFLSGYLYQDKYSTEPFTFIKNRIKSLYVPFVKYSLLFLLLHNLFVKLNIYSEPNFYTLTRFLREVFNIITFGGTEKLLGIFWFITALYWVNVIYCFIRYFTSKIPKSRNEFIFLALIVLMFLIGNLFSLYSINLPRVLDIALVSLLFYHGGYLYRRYQEKIPLDIFITICCILFLLISSLYGKVNMIGRSYVNPAFIIVNSAAGIYLIFYISKVFVKSYYLNYIGRNTLIILALHLLSFKVISLIQVLLYDYHISMIGEHPVIHINSGSWWVVYSVAGISIPLLISFLGTKTSSFTRAILASRQV